jgi:hypothetical protein
VDTLATALYATTDDMLKEHPGLAPWRPPVGVERRRMGRGLHPGGMRPLPRDRQTLRPGRLGRIRLLPQPRPLLLGPAPAPGLHPSGPAHRLRPDRGQGHERETLLGLLAADASFCESAPGRLSSATRTTSAVVSNANCPSMESSCCGLPVKVNGNGMAQPCSSRCGRSSNRSTRPSRDSLTSNGTEGAHPEVS